MSPARSANAPLAVRCATMRSAIDLLSPGTRDRRGTLAVLRLTPAAATADSTTAPSSAASSLSLTSCWYRPTPSDCGSIFTSSAIGSCSRRAMDTAPRRDTSTPGSSATASSEALYTDAPASLTTLHPTLVVCDAVAGVAAVAWVAGAGAAGAVVIVLVREKVAATSCSASRVPTPSPMATARAPWRSQNARSFAPASLPASPPPPCPGRCTTDVSTSAPVASTAASLHPVRYAGSSPTTTAAGRMGGANNRERRFAPKSITARLSPSSRSFARASRSTAGRSSRLTPSRTASETSLACAGGRGLGATALVAARTAGASSHSTCTRSTPAVSARKMARVWWGCTERRSRLKDM
mmetsp:Transcript_21698/g.53582  ORF Transcript_21698/g.53582 Transcript_21698/m.53582 type:complete len:353 (+) Transcript_21698:801-1859(+)